MMSGGNYRGHGFWRALGRLFAMLAMLSPVLLGPVVHAALMREAPAMDCPGDMDAPAHHHAPDCAICPLCAALAHPAIAWAPAPMVPAPSVAVLSRPESPRGTRAPPRLFASAAQPRGPPSRA